MDLQLESRVILVVGGHGVIGRAVVDRLREERAVAIPASRRDAGGVRLDASDEESVTSAVQGLMHEHGRIIGVVVSAAPQTLHPGQSSTPRAVLEAVEGKALTFLRVANAVIPGMLAAAHGRIVGISGQSSIRTGNMAGSVRSATLDITAKHLADSLAGTGVTVNAVSPGMITPTPSTEFTPPLGGESTPEDVATLIAFLLSPIAGAISGESIAVGHRAFGVVAR